MDTSLQVFERKPYHRTFFGELKRAQWILRKKRKMHRTEKRVHDSYEQTWALPNDKWEEQMREKRYEVVLGNELLTVDGPWLSMYYAQLVHLWIQLLGGKKVLEVGSGRGTVLFELKRLNPQLQLSGVELAGEGVKRSLEKQKELGTNITFVEGNAKKLPFEDNSFDTAFTVHVLESMPRDYDKAVSEMARVATYGIFIEEFREAQSIADLTWLKYKDRFRSSYKLPYVEPLYFTKDLPHKEKYSMGLCIGRFRS